MSTRLAVDAPDQASCRVLAPNPGACPVAGGRVITTPPASIPSESLDFGPAELAPQLMPHATHNIDGMMSSQRGQNLDICFDGWYGS